MGSQTYRGKYGSPYQMQNLADEETAAALSESVRRSKMRSKRRFVCQLIN